MSDKIRKILIVGGGTAGWLTAAILAKKLSTLSDKFSVTLIESSDIPTIGVGEGTFPTMLDTLQYIGISEHAFINACHATFKQGIEFVDWLHSPNSKAHSYHHLFNPPAQSDNFDLVKNWLSCRGNKPDFAHSVSAQAFICDEHLSPKLKDSTEYQSKTRYAYHLDAGAFVELLKKHATQVLGVEHKIATVSDVIQSDNGDLKLIKTQCQQEIRADLFIDCSGFSALLIGKTLQSPFIDLKDTLFVDYAVAIQVPNWDKQQTLPSQTISTAQEAGWIWDIGLSHRQGIGYVYSSRYTEHSQAEQVLRDYVHKVTGNAELATSLSARKIPMRVGYREKAWVNNCIALGFAGGFVEPLEATAISMVEAAALALAGQFPQNKASMPIMANKFNYMFTQRWEKIVEFIKLHYCLSNRVDHSFWIDNRKNVSIPQGLQEKLALWKFFPPQENDFASRYEMFTLASYQYVLYGMQFKTDITQAYNQQSEDIAQHIFKAIAEQGAQAKIELPDHRELINFINGLSNQTI